MPAKLILDTLKALPEQPISFEVDERLGIQITSAYGKYRLAGADAADFPKLPKPESVEQLNLSVSLLERAVAKNHLCDYHRRASARHDGRLFLRWRDRR